MEFIIGNFYFFVCAVTGLYVSAGALILTVRYPVKISVRTIGMLLTGVYLWSLTDALIPLLAAQVAPEELARWAVVLLLPALLLPVVYFRLAISLLDAGVPLPMCFRHRKKMNSALVGIAVAVWVIALLRNDLLFSGFVTRGAGDYSFVPGPLFLPVGVILLAGVVIPSLLLLKTGPRLDFPEEHACAWGALISLCIIVPSILLSSPARFVHIPRIGCLGCIPFFGLVFGTMYYHGIKLPGNPGRRLRGMDDLACSVNRLAMLRDPDQLQETLCNEACRCSGSRQLAMMTFDAESKNFVITALSRTPELLVQALGGAVLRIHHSYPLESGSELYRLCRELRPFVSSPEQVLLPHLSTDQICALLKIPGCECVTGYPVQVGKTRAALIALKPNDRCGDEILRLFADLYSIVLRLTEKISVLESDRRHDRHIRETQKMEAVGRLAGGIAHDFNNLLSGISGYAALIKRKYAGTDEKLLSYVDPIIAAAQRAADLTGQLLSFARRGNNRRVEIDANALVNRVAGLLTGTVDTNIKVVAEPRAAASTLVGDPGLVENALINLALNGRDALAGIGGCLRLQTDTLRVTPDDAATGSGPPHPGLYVVFIIADTGLGMDEETRARMFEPFFTTKEKGKTAGLGLAGVYGCVNSHNGHIDVDTIPGKGTTVKLYFPAIERSNNPPASVSEVRPPKTISRHILVVDDEPVVRAISKDMLEDLGYQVTICGDGQEAVEYFRTHTEIFDLAIIDMIMPRMGGYECVRELRKLKPELKIIISTGYSMAQDTQQVIMAGISAYLQKPFEHSDLSKIVSETLAS